MAVLPFETLSDDPGQAYFARGFVQDLITALSRFPTLEVLHPDTSLADVTNPQGLGALGARYVLRGSVRRSGDVVRVATQLVEGGSGQQRWAERFDAAGERLLAVQDEIAARVASTLAVEIDTARLAHARRKPLASLEVYDCWLRGLDALHRGTIEDDARAREFFERALAIDPAYARGHSGLSLPHFSGVRVHFAPYRTRQWVARTDAASDEAVTSPDGFLSGKDSGCMFYVIRLA